MVFFQGRFGMRRLLSNTQTFLLLACAAELPAALILPARPARLLPKALPVLKDAATLTRRSRNE